MLQMYASLRSIVTHVCTSAASIKSVSRPKVSALAGAYGLPKLRNSDAYKQYDDIELGVSFLYPGSWVQRANHQRAGVYISNFDVSTADPLYETHGKSALASFAGTSLLWHILKQGCNLKDVDRIPKISDWPFYTFCIVDCTLSPFLRWAALQSRQQTSSF